MRKDLTMNGNHELSLNYLNDESLYNEMAWNVKRSQTFAIFTLYVSGMFIYTDEQLKDLEETYNNEISELNQK